ncbi:MAG: UPF0280 family protein [Candidatus Hodarchaeales archaeon]
MIVRHFVKIHQTIATVVIEEEFIPLLEKIIITKRRELESFIRDNPSFLTSLEPVEFKGESPSIVSDMIRAGNKAGVGPMASVAGAIAYHVVKELINSGVQHVIFDNGGDIAFYIEKPVTVGIYPSDFGLVIEPRDCIFGICTSSAAVGPSLSLGFTDASVVISNDVILADAYATALGNRVKDNDRNNLEKTLIELKVSEIDCLLVIIDGLFAKIGNMPPLVEVNTAYELITHA